MILNRRRFNGSPRITFYVLIDQLYIKTRRPMYNEQKQKTLIKAVYIQRHYFNNIIQSGKKE